MGVFASHDIRIVDNTFRNNPGPGIHLGGSDDNLIKGNLFSQSSPGVLIGGDEASERVTATRCETTASFETAEASSSAPAIETCSTRNHFSRDG